MKTTYAHSEDESVLNVLAHAQNRQEGFLWNIHLANALHALFAFLLFLQQLALTTAIATLTPGDNILS